jgi:dolichol-phosphate mannosyltransferase
LKAIRLIWWSAAGMWLAVESAGGTPGRAKMSAVAARLSRIICKAEIADLMSGFFMLRREVLDGALRRLSAQGF